MGNKERRYGAGIATILLLAGLTIIAVRERVKTEDNEGIASEGLSSIPSPTPPRYLRIGEGKQEPKGSPVPATIDLPFIGVIQCLSVDYTVAGDRWFPTEQVWRVFCTPDGTFVGADFLRPGVAEPAYDRQYMEDIYSTRSQRIVGLVKGEPQIELADLRSFAAEQSEFGAGPNAIERITIRRVLLTSEIMVPEKEVYIMTVWAKGTTISPSWTGSAARMVFDSRGNGIFMDNGY